MNFPKRTKKFVRLRPMDDVRIALTTPAVLQSAPRAPNRTAKPFGWGNVLVLAVVYALFFTTTGYTISYFNDLDHSVGNSVSAGKLDLIVSTEGSLDNRFNLEGGSNALVTFSATSSAGDFETQYGIAAEKVGGSDAFCALINAFSPTGVPFAYDGPLLGLQTASTTSFTSWPLLFTIAGDTSNIVQDESCSVDLVYRGSIVGALPGNGYQDIERIQLVFTADAPAPVAELLTQSLSVQGAEEEPTEEPDQEEAPLDETPPVDDSVPADDEKEKEKKEKEEKETKEKSEKEEKAVPESPEPENEEIAEIVPPPPPVPEPVEEEVVAPEIPADS